MGPAPEREEIADWSVGVPQDRPYAREGVDRGRTRTLHPPHLVPGKMPPWSAAPPGSGAISRPRTAGATPPPDRRPARPHPRGCGTRIPGAPDPSPTRRCRGHRPAGRELDHILSIIRDQSGIDLHLIPPSPHVRKRTPAPRRTAPGTPVPGVPGGCADTLPGVHRPVARDLASIRGGRGGGARRPHGFS